MQHDKHTLSKYRFERAQEDIISAAANIENNQYKTSLNRSYYAIFHGMRAVNALDGFDASKHSSVTAHFNQYHVEKYISCWHSASFFKKWTTHGRLAKLGWKNNDSLALLFRFC